MTPSNDWRWVSVDPQRDGSGHLEVAWVTFRVLRRYYPAGKTDRAAFFDGVLITHAAKFPTLLRNLRKYRSTSASLQEA